jgi:hypothetical protein
MRATRLSISHVPASVGTTQPAIIAGPSSETTTRAVTSAM